MKARTKQYIQNVKNGFLKTNNEKVLHWIKHNPMTSDFNKQNFSPSRLRINKSCREL